MSTYIKELIGAEDVNFDLNGTGESFSRKKSDGLTHEIQKYNAGHLPLLLATRTSALYSSGALSANDVDTALQQICASLAGVPVFDNAGILSAIVSGGSNSIITTSERAKLNSITDVGSGQMITSIERSKLAGLSSLTENELSILASISTLFPVGMMASFPISSVPTNFLECNGALLSRTTYSELYGVIGTAYGNGDSTNFNIPDYRGQFLRGWDNSAATDPDAGSRTDRGDGVSGDVVGAKQDWAFGHIDLYVGNRPAGGGEGHSKTGDQIALDSDTYGRTLKSANAGAQDIIGATNSVNNSTETRPPNISVVHCIRYQAS